MVELVKKTSKRDEFAARRLILKKRAETAQSFADQLKKVLAPAELKEFSQSKIDKMYENFWEFYPAVAYMTEVRGFEEETLHDFKIGYSSVKDLIVVPMHDAKGMPIGVIGRSLSTEDKRFKNSSKLPTSKTLFNMHRAKRQGEKVIVVEASFDAMRVHQAGYPNVVATLSGHISPYHLEQLDKYFSEIVIMTDFDKKQFYADCKKCAKAKTLCVGHNPGRDLGATIASSLPNKRIRWAAYDEKLVYPHGAKDSGDLSDDEIRQCLRFAVSDWVYKSWGLY